MSKVLIVLFLQSSVCHSQQENIENDILFSFRSYDIVKSEKLLRMLDDSDIKNLLKIEVRSLKEGTIDTTLLHYNSIRGEITKRPNKEKIINNYLLGDYYLKEKENDSIAYTYYNKALEIIKNGKTTFALNHVLMKLSYLLLKNGKDLELYGITVEKYERVAKHEIDKFWAQYYSIMNQFFIIRKLNKRIDEIDLDSDFIKGYQFANNDFIKGVLHQLQGIYYDALKNDFYKATFNYERAKEIYSMYDHFEGRKLLIAVKINLGIILYHKGEYSEAIGTFRNALSTNITSNGQIDKQRISEWIMKSYDSIKKYDSAYFFSKKANFIKDSLNQIEHSKAMRENNIIQKEEKIKDLTREKKSLQTQLLTFLPILGLISIILMITYFLYKRYKKRSRTLEKDQSETLQKLDELKNIVIKNHIILKDKTKVYISDLMYIKSDDHYLNVFLSEGKNQFVRGKLSQIKEELPPNFIQCHRSYIVNANFIKQVNGNSLTLIDKTQIPLSRSYKDKF